MQSTINYCIMGLVGRGKKNFVNGNPATDTIAKLDMYSDLYLKDMEETE